MKKAVLVVSFGTTNVHTIECTIGKIEKKIEEQIKGNSSEEIILYRAFSSARIIQKIQQKSGIHIFTVQQALEQIKQDGIEHVIVQPTFVMQGLEYDEMIGQIERYKDQFQDIRVGAPLLNDLQDYKEVVAILTEVLEQASWQKAIILMGHGTTSQANQVYDNLNNMFRKMQYNHVYVAVLREHPSLEDVLLQLRKNSYQEVFLLPFMLVTGYHVLRDMIGESDNAWVNRLRKEGYKVEYSTKALGEYEMIQELFGQHAKKARKQGRKGAV